MARILTVMREYIIIVLMGISAAAVAHTYGDTIVHQRSVDEVEVTARRVSRDISGPQSVQTLDGDDMRRSGTFRLADAVRRFAGVSVQDYGGQGGLKTVSVRSLGAHHTAVSYNGVVMSNTQAGQIDLSRYTTDNINRVTLTTGSGDDIMQSARHTASGAVLDIVTAVPAFDDGKRDNLRMRLRTGSWGLLSPTLNYCRQLGGNTTIALDGSYMRSDGIYPYSLSNGRETITGRRSNSDISSWQGEASLRTVFNDSSSLAVRTGMFSSRRGLPGAVIFYDNPSRERLADEDFFAQTIFSRRLGRTLRLATRARYSHTWNRYTDRDVKYTDGLKREVNRQDEYYASATIGWFPIARLSLALAQDVALNTLNMLASAAPDPRRLTSLTALTLRYKTSRLESVAALTGTFASEHVHSGRRPDPRRRLSPSLSVAWRPLDREPLYLRAMVRHTFRMPTFNDLYYDRIGTIDLRPERAREYSIGVAWTSSRLPLFDYLSIAVDAYHNEVHDKIVATPTLYVWKMANYGRVRIDGLSATFAAGVSVARGADLRMQGSYMLQRSVDVTDSRQPGYKHQLPYTPRHTGSAAVTLHTPWVDLGYTLTGCAKRYSMIQSTHEYLIPGYCDQSVALSRALRLGRHTLDMQLVVRNIAGEHYEIIKYYPMPGRSLEFSAAIGI